MRYFENVAADLHVTVYICNINIMKLVYKMTKSAAINKWKILFGYFIIHEKSAYIHIFTIASRVPRVYDTPY